MNDDVEEGAEESVQSELRRALSRLAYAVTSCDPVMVIFGTQYIPGSSTAHEVSALKCAVHDAKTLLLRVPE